MIHSNIASTTPFYYAFLFGGRGGFADIQVHISIEFYIGSVNPILPTHNSTRCSSITLTWIFSKKRKKCRILFQWKIWIEYEWLFACSFFNIKVNFILKIWLWTYFSIISLNFRHQFSLIAEFGSSPGSPNNFLLCSGGGLRVNEILVVLGLVLIKLKL